MMHEHDHELIAAIADGAMNQQEQAVAEASLASCEVCSKDLELQREALVALRAAPVVIMTDLEKAELHRRVAAEFTPLDKKSDSKAAVPWFHRLMPVMAAAAALLVVVGVGSVLVNGSGSTDTAAVTTAANDTQRTAAEEGLSEATDSAEFDDAAELAPTTIAAQAAPESSIQEYGSISSAELADIADRLVGEVAGADSYPRPPELHSLSVESALVCEDIARGEGTVTAIGRATVDGDEVEIYLIDALVNVYSITDCSLIAMLE